MPEPNEGFALATIVDLGMDEVTVQPMGASRARFALPLDRVYTADPHFDNKDVDDNCKRPTGFTTYIFFTVKQLF